MNVAVNYFSSDQKKRSRAEQLLADGGITADMIEGFAMAENFSIQKLIQDLVHRHEVARDRLIKKAVKRGRKKSDSGLMLGNKMNDRTDENNPRPARLPRKRFSLVDVNKESDSS